ncbi:siderophore synthetase component [Inquilinus ginsengisoli]|uniref:IucA/IucC family protein n=1 Tax=Inquilinus ginsengisoli TaxID=363840 RepID=UPI003D1D39D6
MTAAVPLSIEASVALARRRALERLLRCALSEGLLDSGNSATEEDLGVVRASLRTAAGTLQFRCRPPFIGWRHAEFETVVLCPRGSLPRRLDNPFDLIAFLGSLHPDGRWERLRDEVEDSLQNEALSIHVRSERDRAIAEAARNRGCPTLLDWVRRSLPAAEWTSFFEQWGAIGHPHHPCSKTRIGFTIDDSRRYAPEFGQRIGVPWLAVRRGRIATEVVSSNLEPQAFLKKHFPTAMDRWRSAITAHGADPETYFPIPVHPWQWGAVVEPGFRGEIARGDILKPGDIETECLAMLSLRTLEPVDARSSPHLKLPLSIQVTSSRRDLGPGVISAGPWMTRRLDAVLHRDERLRSCMAVLGEPFGAYLRPAYSGDERSGMLSMLLRRPVAGLLRPGEAAIPVAALFVPSPVTGKPLFLELIAAAGQDPAAFFGAYCRIALGALLRLSLLHGIALEAHQQNTLVIVDERHRITRIVARDFGARVLAETVDPSDPIPAIARDIAVAGREALREMVSHAVLESHVRELVALLARHGAAAPAASWRRAAIAVEDVLGGIAGELDTGTLGEERTALFRQPWRVKSLLRMRIAEHHGDSFIESRNPFARVP